MSGTEMLIRRTLMMIGRAIVEWEDFDGVRIGVLVPFGYDENLCRNRVKSALDVLVRLVPYRWTRMKRDVREILCVSTGRNSALGAYAPIFRACLVDPRHVLDPRASPLHVAMTIVHEGTHARLHEMGIGRKRLSSPRVEQICERAERDLARKFRASAEGG